VLWLDIEHTDGKRYFTWDAIKFPNPVETLTHISSFGRKMVTIVDPHIKVDSNYEIYSEAKEKGYFIKNKDGHDMEGWCWPGQSSWLDYLNVDVRKWYASKFSLEEYKGSTYDLYTWNDMNEMSVFSGPEVTCPKDTLHHGGWENRHVHNLYGMLQALSTYDGHFMRSNAKQRPFILSRSFFVGSQRAGAIWTGDNAAEWSHLKISIPMLLSLSVTGIAHCGADVGGFFKNPDSELLVRWYQAGAYQPFFRAHAHIDTKRREPWLFDDQTKALIKDAIHARYALLYYWYTLFYHTEKTGVSPMLPLWANFPTEKETFPMDDIYMIGSALLVKPVTEAGASSISVYFPGQDEVLLLKTISPLFLNFITLFFNKSFGII
jgi:mannosyl-oligosaccharide alpha-1,3-glucosidase